VAGDLVTAYGCGLDAAWQGLLSGRSALKVSPAADMQISGIRSVPQGCVPGLTRANGISRVRALLQTLPLHSAACGGIPRDAALFLATTVGAVDLLEDAVLEGINPDAGHPLQLLEEVRACCGTYGPAAYISAACASSTSALARAAERIRFGRSDVVCVVACDAISEFVCSGFSSLQALDPSGSRPFDRARCGLSLGEAAGIALLMSAKRAQAERRPVLGWLDGWGESCDAYHLTTPIPDGTGLVQAVRTALNGAGYGLQEIATICAHGTGTIYNDAMELRAFHALFGDEMPPVWSAKGGIGHTLGAAGLVEALLSIRSLHAGIAPPTVGFRQPDLDACAPVTMSSTPLSGQAALTTNSGFGGLNAALLLTTAETECAL
jgi:3-oxoacyl-[acyl-carrier-protein] synthase II